jgi:hypothetical protein
MITAFYAATYTQLERIAWRHGYALALHGSMGRDLDVLAVPWTEDADAARDLLAAFRRAVYSGHPEWRKGEPSPTKKPHGRRAYSLYLGHQGHYVDISIMPRRKTR